MTQYLHKINNRHKKNLGVHKFQAVKYVFIIFQNYIIDIHHTYLLYYNDFLVKNNLFLL